MKVNFEPESMKEALVLNGLRHMVSSVKEAVTNFTSTQVKDMYDKCVKALESNPRFAQMANFDVRAELAKLGINNAEDLKNFIISKKNEFKYTGLSALQAYLETQLQEIHSTVGARQPFGNPDNLVACRNSYGNGPVLFYSLKDYTLGEIKKQYAADTNTAYTDARPIMYNKWVTLSPEMQKKTK